MSTKCVKSTKEYIYIFKKFIIEFLRNINFLLIFKQLQIFTILTFYNNYRMNFYAIFCKMCRIISVTTRRSIDPTNTQAAENSTQCLFLSKKIWYSKRTPTSCITENILQITLIKIIQIGGQGGKYRFQNRFFYLQFNANHFSYSLFNDFLSLTQVNIQDANKFITILKVNIF